MDEWNIHSHICGKSSIFVAVVVLWTMCSNTYTINFMTQQNPTNWIYIHSSIHSLIYLFIWQLFKRLHTYHFSWENMSLSQRATMVVAWNCNFVCLNSFVNFIVTSICTLHRWYCSKNWEEERERKWNNEQIYENKLWQRQIFQWHYILKMKW